MDKLYDDETQAQMGWYEGEIDRDSELAKAKERGWLDEDASVGAESDAKIKLAKAKENASKPALRRRKCVMIPCKARTDICGVGSHSITGVFDFIGRKT